MPFETEPPVLRGKDAQATGFALGRKIDPHHLIGYRGTVTVYRHIEPLLTDAGLAAGLSFVFQSKSPFLIHSIRLLTIRYASPSLDMLVH